MRNEALDKLDALTGTWQATMTGSWFLESLDVEVPGSASFSWLGESFLQFRWSNDESPEVPENEQVLVLGRSDVRDSYVALYHDERGVCRVFDMTFTGTNWTLERTDPDMYQRFTADVGPDRIAGRWEASDDQGATWRKDFDLILDRTSG